MLDSCGVDLFGQPEGRVRDTLEPREGIDIHDIRPVLADHDVEPEQIGADDLPHGQGNRVQLLGDGERLALLLPVRGGRPLPLDAEDRPPMQYSFRSRPWCGW